MKYFFDERRLLVDLETKICCEKSTSLFMILYVVHKLRHSLRCSSGGIPNRVSR